MANAKKCDICGRLYEAYAMRGPEPNSIRFVQEYNEKNNYVCIKHFDCCSPCLLSIREHIKQLRFKNEE